MSSAYGGETNLMQKIKEEIKALCLEFGVDDMKVYLTNNYAIQGQCYPMVKTMLISKNVYRYNSKEGKRALIGHEIAHLKDVRHNKVFVDEMARLNVDDKHTIKVTKYAVFCPRCSTAFGWNKKNKEKFICKKCYDKYGEEQEMMVYKHVEVKNW